MIPEPYELVLLVLISFRAWRLLAEDDVLERPRRWLVRLPYDWQAGDPAAPNPLPKGFRWKLAEFISCSWCLGAWVSLATYLVYLSTLGEWPDSTSEVVTGVGVWFALAAAVGLIDANLNSDEE